MNHGSETNERLYFFRDQCLEIFRNKHEEYGPTWLVLRPLSLIDHILIKAIRIRTIERPNYEKKIDEDVLSELIGVANYCAMGMVRSKCESEGIKFELSSAIENVENKINALKSIEEAYDEALQLLVRKNSDYGEAWRLMEPETFTDEIILRCNRMKKIARASNNENFEAIMDQLGDTMNYSLFAMIVRSK